MIGWRYSYSARSASALSRFGLAPGRGSQRRLDRDPAVARRLDADPRADDAALLEPLGDRLEERRLGHELLELDAPLRARQRRDHEQPHRAGLRAVAGGDRADPADVRRRLAGEMLEVLGGDGAAARAQPDRPADLGVLDVLAVDAAPRVAPVLDARDERDRRLEDPERRRRETLPRRPPPVRYSRIRMKRSLLGHGAVAPQAAVGLADGRPEPDLADRCRRAMKCRSSGPLAAKSRDLRPRLPGRAAVAAGRTETRELRRLVGREDRRLDAR